MAITLRADTDNIKWKQLRDFGKCKTPDDITAWMVANAGAVESDLDEATVAEVLAAQKQFMAAVIESAVPKVSGSN